MNVSFLKTKESKNAIWIICGKVAQMMLSLVVGMLSARYLGPSNYGTISYATSLTSFFMAFCTLGLQSVLVKTFVENPQEQGVALGTAIFMRIVSSFASCIMIICISFVVYLLCKKIQNTVFRMEKNKRVYLSGVVAFTMK